MDDHGKSETHESKNLKQPSGSGVFKRASLVFVILFALVGAVFLLRSFAATPPGVPTLKVQGAQFVDQNGSPVQLRGINRAGTEYACTQGSGFTTSATGASNVTSTSYADTVASSLLSWDNAGTSEPLGPHAINTVRVPLNEACWLGVAGTNAAYSGQNYINFITAEVNALSKQGMYVVLDDHWPVAPKGAIPGLSGNPTQGITLSEQWSVPFWKGVASTFNATNGYPNVMYDLINEPTLNCTANNGNPVDAGPNGGETCAWRLYKNGGTINVNTADNGTAYSKITGPLQIAGMQEITNDIRGVGAMNPIAVETLGGGSGYETGMEAGLPTDTSNTVGSPQIVGSIHAYANLSGYNFGNAQNVTGTMDQLQNGKDANYNGVAGVYGHQPVFVGEVGTTGCASPDTQTSYALNYLNSISMSYTVWGWDAGEGCQGPGLVTNNDTGATSPSFPEGVATKAVLQSAEGTGGGTVTPPPPPPTSPTVKASASASTATAPANFTVTATSNLSATITIASAGKTLTSCANATTCSYSAANYAAGSYTFTATATTSTGGSGSASTTVTVTSGTVTNKPPTVSLSATSTSLIAPATINLSATASDSDGTVSKVQLYSGGSAVGTADTSAPYSFALTNYAAGSYTFNAQATDNLGATSALSNTITITVSSSSTTPPVTQAPSNLVATSVSSTQVGLSWTGGLGNDNYLIKDDNGDNDWTTGTTYTLTHNLVSGNHTYFVIGYSNGAVAGRTNDLHVVVPAGAPADTQAPSTPGGVKATAAAYNQVNLSWTASTDNVGVTGYDVVRNGVTIAITSGTGTTYTDNSVNASTAYSYQLIAFDAASNLSALSTGSSVTTPSTPDTTAPSAPTKLVATAVSSTQINLTWTASTDNVGVTGYDVYRGTTKIATVTTTSYGDTGLTASTAYSYTVKAHDAAGNPSLASNAAPATTQAATVVDTAPVWPAGSTLTAGYTFNWWPLFQGCEWQSYCKMTVKWSPATDDHGVTSYQVLRTVGKGSTSVMATLPGTSLSVTDPNVTSGLSYTYQIVALDAANHATPGLKLTKSINCSSIFYCQ